MVDLHCHILPGVDDGAKSWEMTLEMCRIAYADGIRHIIATPHANGRYVYERSRHSESIALLRETVPFMQFSLGCDLHLSHENIQEALKHPERYAIDGTPYLLVEFSDFQTPHQMTESLFRLHSAGFHTIVTHPERNPIMDEFPDLPERLFDMGSVLQITAGALCGFWGKRPKKTSEALLKKGLVSFIATDAHDPKHRVPVLSPARRAAAKIVGPAEAEFLVQGNPCAVISNQSQSEEVPAGFEVI